MSNYDDREELPPIEVPKDLLSDDALENIIKEFILREGTDYGVSEITFDKKFEQVERQIDKGDIKIVFDQNSESVTLMTLNDWKKLTKKPSP
ncbi:hypothetical protein BDW_02410 [Bdellovibrio bacteriovorus W]|nr:hypothetical protein BDW_02410 [Bdellovibrio bacteriovorus W]